MSNNTCPETDRPCLVPQHTEGELPCNRQWPDRCLLNGDIRLDVNTTEETGSVLSDLAPTWGLGSRVEL